MTACTQESSFLKGLAICLALAVFAFGVAQSRVAAAAESTLVLQPGSTTRVVHLGSTGPGTLLVGTGGSGASLPTATVTGNIISIGDTVIQTNGANLVVGGTVYPTGLTAANDYKGEMRAWNGNISINGSSGQNQVGILSVYSGRQVYSRTRLVIDDLSLQNGARVNADGEVHINGALGRTSGYVMRAGSLLSTTSNIVFLDPRGSISGGIQAASGTIHAGGSIGPHSTYPAYDLNQGQGNHLRIEAGGDIGAASVSVDAIIAGGTIVAGTKSPGFAANPLAYGITPANTLAANTISAGLIAAGEVHDLGGAVSRVEAGRMMVVNAPGSGEGSQASSGNFTLSNGSFRLTGTEPIGNAEYRGGRLVSHNEASWVSGKLDVNNNGASSFTTLGVAGAARIGGGSLSGDALSAGSVTLHDGIDATVNSISVTGGDMQVGAAADSAATDVKIGSLRQIGHALNVGAGVGQAFGAVENFVTAAGAGNLTDGDITVGHNGRLAVGTAKTSALRSIVARTGVGPETAVLGVFSPLVLGANLNVDHTASVGAATRSLSRAATGTAARAASGPVSFSGNSLLVIDGAKRGVNYANPSVPTAALPASVPGAISTAAPTATTVPAGAKIYIDHVTPGHTYVALGRNITTSYADDTAWSGANLISSNPLLGLIRLGDGKEGQFSVTEKAPHTKSVGVASGVPRLSRAASESVESAIYSRIKLGQEDLYRHSFALWAIPLYESIDHFGLDGGTASYGFRGGLGGLAIGGDYTWDNTLRAGLSLNLGAGYVKSTGDMATTQNSANFWGVGAYGVWKPGAFSLDAEIDYTSVYNKVRQDLPADVEGTELKADIPAWSLGMSLRVEYEIDTRYVNLRPHLGVRYLHMVTEPFDATLNGKEVLHGLRTHQNVWTMPFGLVFTKPFRLENGFEITPLVNLKAIPALSDTYATTRVRYAGSHADQDFESQVMDDITYGGRAGVELRAGAFSAALNYIAQFGEHTANQGLFGVLRYEF